MTTDNSTPDRWERVRGILERALELPTEQRDAFIDVESGGDPSLAAEVRTYLSASAEDGLLDRSLDDVVDAMVSDEGSTGRAEEDTWPRLPDRIGDYHVLELLGEGGMGTVYRAEQRHPVRREVALKVIRAGMDSTEVVARFESERQALAVMDHTSIARVLDAGSTSDGRPYFAMELVQGVPIGEFCDEERLGTRERIELFIQVGEAVQHAHLKGVIHRDLKPSNVLVAVQDDRPIAKVIDFGIAKAGGLRPAEAAMTSIGQVLGTPAYMSPEQAEGSGLDVDSRADVYSLGVMLYELLSGTLPFDRELFRKPDFVVRYLLQERAVPTPSARLSSLADTQETVARNRHTDVRTLRRELRGDLDWIVMKAMEKDRDRRYGTAAELIAELARFLGGQPVVARPPTLGYRMQKFARRNRGPLAAAGALVLSLGVGAAAATMGFLEAERNAEVAEAEAERAEAAARRSEAVSSFLNTMLRAADPVRGGTPETTVREVLDQASEDVDSGALDEEPLVEAAVRRSIGGTYMLLGVYDAAREHLEAAQALLDETPDADPEDRVRNLSELGQLARRESPLDAVPILQTALALAESTGVATDGGDGERLTNGIRGNLGLVFRDLDRIDEAADILSALAESERRLLEPDDLDLATTLNNLALVRNRQGRVDEAVGLFHETLAVLRAAFGDEHPYVAAVLESIGSLEQQQGRYTEADSLMTLALDVRKAVLGEQHPDIINGLNGLALLHLDMGELDAAEGYLDEGLAMSLELLGPDHFRTAQVLNTIGILRIREDDAPGAEEAFRRAFEIRLASFGPTHRNTLNARTGLANALLGQGRAEAAASMTADIVTIQDEQGLIDPVLVGSTRRVLGRSLTDLGRFDEAEQRLLQAWELQENALGADHVHTQSNVVALIALYDAWGRSAEAAEWRRRSTR
ncbi:MAG: tetratricopeptide repeat protein [Gemmatimonadota bacterium]